MLRIEHLHVAGFKSFCDRVEVNFPSGITGIVGPNGCGKSNIGDALHWVLGEQSSRTLRGERMEDVIFSGTEARRQIGMAEVRLRLAGPPGALPGGRDGVEIGRRLFRSGESEYLIDGQRARLRDIQELLETARVGARTHAVIEQGKVDQILLSRPKERRLLIEEAAGIAGYKQKKRLSELKLEATEANLLRVSDIVGEVSRQISSLKRQAARARRYARLRDELRSRQKRVYGFQADHLDLRIAELERTRAAQADAESGLAATLGRLEAEAAEQRAALAAADTDAAARREEVHRLDVAVERETQQRGASAAMIAEIEARAGVLRAALAQIEARLQAAREDEAARSAEAQSLALEQARLVSHRAAVEEGHAAATARTGELRLRIEASRTALLAAREAAVAARNEIRRLDEDLARGGAAIERLAAEGAQAAAALAEKEERLSAIRAERADAEASARRLADEAAAASETKARVSRSAGEAEAEAGRARAASAAAGERLRTLSDAESRFSGRNEGVRWVLTEGVQAGVRARGVLADFLRSDLEVERAAEGYLAELLPAVLVEENDDLLRAARLLRESGAGRCLFLAARNGHTPLAESRMPDGLASESGVLGPLSSRLRTAGIPTELISRRFDEAIVVEDLPRALALHASWPGTDFVTRDGEVVRASGLVAGGRSTDGGEGLLAQSRAIEEARLGQKSAEIEATTAGTALEQVRAALADAESRVGGVASRQARMEQSLIALRLGEQRAEDDAATTRRTAALLDQEQAQLREEQQRLTAQRDQASQQAARMTADQESAERALQGAESEEAGLRAALAGSGEEVVRLRAEEAAMSERHAAAVREAAARQARVMELLGSLETDRGGLDADDRRREALQAEDLQAAARLAGLLEQREAAGRSLDLLDAQSAAARAEIDAREADTRQARARLEDARSERQQSEIGAARAISDREHLATRCLDDLGEPLDTLLTAWRAAAEAAAAAAPAGGEEGAPGAVPADDPAAEEAAVADLRRRLEDLGPVNMMALEEFSELEERHKFLTAQQADLRASIESLRESIRKINRSSRERFVSAFEEIRGHFNQVFKLLFGGGHADLILEEEADALEAGLDIVAQPPGKRPARISLLSGGERALTAIALLFAIFRYKPSPFCLLDEVDAPLDEANVVRFTRMLREYARETQFIVITHNRRSMEVADVLYGVTMPEAGVSRVVSMRLPEPVAH